MLLHYFLLSVGVNLLYLLIMAVTGQAVDFYDWAVLINGVTSLAVLPLFVWLYRKDLALRSLHRRKTKLSFSDGIWAFLWGGSLAVVLNIVFALLQIFQRFPAYSEQSQRMMENVNIFWIVLWTAVVAPLVEEVVCRGLVFGRLRDYLGRWSAIVISGLMFGIYHGNVVQAIYASILGILMAILVELTGTLWSSILFHVGANLISVLYSNYALQAAGWNNGILLAAFMLLQLMLLWSGGFYFYGRWQKKKRKAAS